MALALIAVFNARSLMPDAQRHQASQAHYVSQKRPPARPAFGGHAEIFRGVWTLIKMPSTRTFPPTVKFQNLQARWGSGVGEAGRVDAPEGIRREPKAYEDEEGAVRSEGSGPQS